MDEDGELTQAFVRNMAEKFAPRAEKFAPLVKVFLGKMGGKHHRHHGQNHNGNDRDEDHQGKFGLLVSGLLLFTLSACTIF